MSRWVVSERYICEDVIVVQAKTRKEALERGRYLLDTGDVTTQVVKHYPTRIKRLPSGVGSYAMQ